MAAIEVKWNLNMHSADVYRVYSERVTTRLIPGWCFYRLGEGQLFVLVIFVQETTFAVTQMCLGSYFHAPCLGSLV